VILKVTNVYISAPKWYSTNTPRIVASVADLGASDVTGCGGGDGLSVRAGSFSPWDRKLSAWPRLLGTNFLHVSHYMPLLPWNCCLNLKLLFVFWDMSVTGRHTRLSLVVYILWFLSYFHIGGWTVRGSNPGGWEIFCNSPHRSWGPPSLVYNGYRISFPGVKRPGRDVNYPPPCSAKVKEHDVKATGPLCHVLGRTLPSLPLITLVNFLISSVGTCSWHRPMQELLLFSLSFPHKCWNAALNQLIPHPCFLCRPIIQNHYHIL